ncbi:MAG: nitrite/sulfite reductase [Alphaproteobacteria bacterium]|nr:nitrite/sulfite reductase [Alphaproteobacteria bacterium]
MYRYDDFDARLVGERAEQFRSQVLRRLAGELSEDEFKPLRLQNGLYLQLHSYMLRIAVPYGTLSANQMRKLGSISRRFSKGYGHFTTRTNLQLHWTRLIDVPDILRELAEVEMHCMQTSGNNVRNVTADPFAGAAADEIEDPRILCEIIRQWSTLHPEFSFLPRKFKICVIASPHDRAALLSHDIAVQAVRNSDGETGYRVSVGGGLGRTPYLALEVGSFVPKRHILAFIEAILRVYNEAGRRDNLWKARVKILVHQLGIDEMRRRVEAEFAEIRESGMLELPPAEIERISEYFAPPDFEDLSGECPEFESAKRQSKQFAAWVKTNVHDHKAPGYALATISLKPIGLTPGDCSSQQMEGLADIMESFGFTEIRVTYEQNLLFPHVRQKDLFRLWQQLDALGLATANHGLVTDIIACPGLDYCDLANARSIPIAQEIARRFADPGLQAELGELKIKISGCINACGHHHLGHIGILGVDRKGVENYQILLGGSGAEDATLAEILGPGFDSEGIIGAVENVIETFRQTRKPGERFLDTYRRIGAAPFKERLYAH